jgi:excinuclease ABC subunit C
MISPEKTKDILKNIPKKPGIYKFIDKKGEVIYVGKAKNLKSRVSSYFQNSKDKTPKTIVMVKNAVDLEYMIVDSELEAIMLETNMIKEIRPKYNILMKDGKNFSYIKITVQDKYPMIYVTRKMVNDGSIYFGPKTSNYDIKKSLNIANSLLPYSKCKLNIVNLKTGRVKKLSKNHRQYPCEIYQLDKGHQPCICTMDKDEYKEVINSIIDFIKGKHNNLLTKLKESMLVHAKNKEFEKAAKARDHIQSIENLVERQKISTATNEEMDVIDIIQSQGRYFANLFQIREGKLISRENFILSDKEYNETENIFEVFITQYYPEAGSIPKTVLIPENIENQNLLEEFLSNLRGTKVKFEIPKIGRKDHLIKLATKNAESYAKQMKVKWMSDEQNNPIKQIKGLKEILELPKIPYRIECYDISHLGGTNTVGSMVVFENGESKRSDYRIFNLKTLKKGEIDDFKALKEVLSRRLKYVATLPEGYKIKKKKDTLCLIKDKENLAELKFIIEDETTKIIEFDFKKEKDELILKFILGGIKKLKTKKFLANPKRKSKLFEEIGFKAIRHTDFTHGYYLNQQTDNSFTTKPDLIVIDGGKGQLSSAIKAKKEIGTDITFISLAKRLEEIYHQDGRLINLEEGKPELRLIQQLRDEAHRFAITKNRKDRLKNLIPKKPA